MIAGFTCSLFSGPFPVNVGGVWGPLWRLVSSPLNTTSAVPEWSVSFKIHNLFIEYLMKFTSNRRPLISPGHESTGSTSTKNTRVNFRELSETIDSSYFVNGEHLMHEINRHYQETTSFLSNKLHLVRCSTLNNSPLLRNFEQYSVHFLYIEEQSGCLPWLVLLASILVANWRPLSDSLFSVRYRVLAHVRLQSFQVRLSIKFWSYTNVFENPYRITTDTQPISVLSCKTI